MKKVLAALLGIAAFWGGLSYYQNHLMQSKPRAGMPSEPPVPHASDHIASSPVGTSSAIVHKTFAITSAAKFAFEVPPHAASPKLNGSYRSFAQPAGSQSSDDSADVDCLLMNAEQYADFAGGHPSDVVYSVDSSHEQDIAFVLPATFDKPVQYYLVFRNSAGHAGETVVQADFRVDF
jgi:hypothetical protein